MLLSFLLHTGLRKYILVSGCSEFTATHKKLTFTEEKRCFSVATECFFPKLSDGYHAHMFVCTPLFWLIFTKLVEVFAFKLVDESEVLRALMSQS